MQFLYKLSTRTFLVLCIVVASFPFLNSRVLRMAGDEKVYVSQAIEMARDGRWFVQTLGGEPNYFKGPLHYILIRIGMEVFGNQLIAGLWMNLLFMIIAGLLLYNLGRKRLSEDSSLLLGMAGALNVGIFSHMLASQMEVELAAFYALAAFGLAKSTDKGAPLNKFRADILFWIAAGAAGWIKSPLHSVLIGGSGIIYWTLTGNAFVRLKSPGAYLAAICGIATCLLGYLPYALHDLANFKEYYIMRETVGKPDNNRPWHYVAGSLVHFALPWFFAVVFALFGFLKIKKENKKLFWLGLSIALPTTIFFSSWPYKGQNYALPSMCGFFILTFAALEDKVPRLAWQIVGVAGFIASMAIAMLVFNFYPLPNWWKLGFPLAAVVSFFIFAVCFLFSAQARVLSLGTVFFFLGFGFTIVPLGEREMTDIRSFVRSNPEIILHYDDLDPSIWSEWGLLQLTLHKEIFGVHKPAQLNEALIPGHAVLVANDAALERVKKAFAEKYPAPMEEESSDIQIPQYKIETWARWMTKGKNANGESMIKVAWKERDLTKLERTFYIFWMPRSETPGAYQ